ncbi:hypothetical protein KCU65_g6383, partial [Aureobasidium melanogenum]
MKLIILLASLAALTVAVPASTARDISGLVSMRIAPTSTTPTTPITSATSIRTKSSVQPYFPEESASCRENICCGKDGRCWRVSPTDSPEKPPGA